MNHLDNLDAIIKEYGVRNAVVMLAAAAIMRGQNSRDETMIKEGRKLQQIQINVGEKALKADVKALVDSTTFITIVKALTEDAQEKGARLADFDDELSMHWLDTAEIMAEAAAKIGRLKDWMTGEVLEKKLGQIITKHGLTTSLKAISNTLMAIGDFKADSEEQAYNWVVAGEKVLEVYEFVKAEEAEASE